MAVDLVSKGDLNKTRWLVVVGGCIIMLAAGLIYMWSVYVLPICTEFGWDTDSVALVSTVLLGVYMACQLVGGFMRDRLGARKAIIIGGALFGLSMIISSFAPSAGFLYFSYGVIGGLGAGILYPAAVFTVGQWFPDKKGLAMSIALCCFGGTLLINSGWISNCLYSIGVRPTLILVGCLFGGLVILSGIFLMPQPKEGWKPDGYVEKVDEVSEKDSMTVKQGLKSPGFWLLGFGVLLTAIPYQMINPFSTVYSTTVKGIDPQVVASVVGMIGGGNIVGRILSGILQDKIGFKWAYTIPAVLSIAVMILLTPASGTLVPWLFFVLGISFGMMAVCATPTAIKIFGPKNAASIYGFATVLSILGPTCAPILARTLRDAPGMGYTTAFYVAAVACVIGLVCIWLIPKKKTTPADNSADKNE